VSCLINLPPLLTFSFLHAPLVGNLPVYTIMCLCFFLHLQLDTETFMHLLINFPVNILKKFLFLPSALHFLQVLQLPGEYFRRLCSLLSLHGFCIGRATAAVQLITLSADQRDMASLVFREGLLGHVVSSPAWLCQMC